MVVHLTVNFQKPYFHLWQILIPIKSTEIATIKVNTVLELIVTHTRVPQKPNQLELFKDNEKLCPADLLLSYWNTSNFTDDTAIIEARPAKKNLLNYTENVSADQILKEGKCEQLHKNKFSKPEWRPTQFKLTCSTLSKIKEKEEKSMKQKIKVYKLRGAIVRILSNKEFCIGLQLPYKEIVIKLPNQDEMDFWLDNLLIATCYATSTLVKTLPIDGHIQKVGWVLKRGKYTKMWNRRLCVITHKVIHFFVEEEDSLVLRKTIKLQDCLFKLVKVGKEEGNAELLSIGEKKSVGHGFLMGVLEADTSSIHCWEEVLKTCIKRANQVQWTNYETLKLYEISKIEKKAHLHLVVVRILLLLLKKELK